MKFLRLVAEVIFELIHPIFKPPAVQRFLRKYIALPYSMAKHLNYSGLVSFGVGDRVIHMQSYNTPIEITVFWRGVFNGREGGELLVWYHLSQWADVVLDIGANTGIYALLSAAERDTLIHAFEPVRVVYKMLEENLALNRALMSHIKPHQIAIGAEDGMVTMYVPKDGWVDVASLDQDFTRSHSTGENLREEVCVGMKLDTFLTKEAISRQSRILCKVDVEGAENLVLTGAKDTIMNGNIIFLIEALDEPAFEKIKSFFPAEYMIYGVDSKRKELFRTDISSDRSNNYLFLKTVPDILITRISL